jgi:diacylglycerol kinase family enzyme
MSWRSPAVLIVNPHAGRLRPSVIGGVVSVLGQRYVLRVLECDRPDEIPSLAREATGMAETVIALGGDGTVSRVATGLIGTAARLAVLPGGSTNHVARLLGMPMAPLAAAKVLAGPTRLRRIDVGWAGDRALLFLGGIGVDALIVRSAPTTVKRFAAWAGYLPAGLRHLRDGPWTVTVTVDDTVLETTARTVLVANGPFLVHPRLRVGHGIRPDDGLLDVCIYSPNRFVDWVTLGLWMLVGHVTRSRHVQQLRGRTIEIRANAPAPVEIDGDYLGFDPLTVMVCPGALTVVAPAAVRGVGED